MSAAFADFWIPARKTRSTGDKLTTSESGGNQEAAVINFRKIPTLSRPSLEHQEIFFQITALLQMPGTGMVEADSYPTWFEEVVECEKADQLPASETFSSSRPPAQPLSPGHGQEPAGCWDGDSLSQRKTPAHQPMAAKEVFWRKLNCLDTSFSGVFQLPKKHTEKAWSASYTFTSGSMRSSYYGHGEYKMTPWF